MSMPSQDGLNLHPERIRGEAEIKLAEGSPNPPPHASMGRWPDAGTIARVALLVIVALIVGGWLLTLLNR